MRRGLSLGLRLTGACLLFAGLLYFIDIAPLLTLFSAISLPHYGVAFALVIAGSFVSTARWGLLLSAVDLRINYLRLLAIYYIGSFFNTYLPSTVGGDVVRIALAHKSTGRLLRSGSSVLAERALGLTALWTIASVAFLLNIPLLWPIPALRGILLCVAAGTAVLLFAIGFPLRMHAILSATLTRLPVWRFPFLEKGIQKLLIVLADIASRRSTLWLSFGMSIVFQLLSVVVKIIVCEALHIEIDPYVLFVVTPIINTVVMVPISIGGIGLREWSSVVLFGMAGIEPEQAVAISLATFGLVLGNALLGGGVYLIWNVRQAAMQWSAE